MAHVRRRNVCPFLVQWSQTVISIIDKFDVFKICFISIIQTSSGCSGEGDVTPQLIFINTFHILIELVLKIV